MVFPTLHEKEEWSNPLICVLLVVSSLCFLLGPCTAQPSVNLTIISDQSSLLALKTAIISDPTGVLETNWTYNTSVCSWIGVTCSIRHNRVIALDLPSRSLLGILPPQLGNLSFLIRFNIQNNSFYGDLPSQLSRLRRLRIISLYLNNFTGNIPSWLGDLPRLQYLDLGNNSYIGSLPNGLFRNGSILETLRMSYNFIDGEIPREIGNLKELRVFNVGNNLLVGDIPTSLFNISSLNQIALTTNSLSGGISVDICSNLPNLTHLYLSDNKLSGEIPSRSFRGCSKLEVLSLGVNKFEGFVPREIGNLTMLKELYLGSNNWQGDVPYDVVNLVNLEILVFQFNNVVDILPNFVFNMSSLKWLYLNGNGYNGFLPSDICSGLPFLERLYLSLNNLIGSITSSIGNCSSLNMIDLSTNNFRGVIPEEVGKLTHLEYLDFGTNQLSGSIPQSIFNISSLQTVFLSFNKLSGNLPSDLGINLPNLGVINLGENNLSGRIPESISNASILYIIEFGNNSLSGPIPNSLGNLRNLQFLNLMMNDLTGLSFITSLANCKFLSTLWVPSNSLNDVLPSSIGNLSVSLSRLELTNCGISGIIPPEIGNLINLNDLSFRNNHLTGYLPVTMNALKRLQRFIARGNMLQGPISDGLCSLGDQLGLLDLGENEFSDQIPDCIGELTFLRELYLDSNKLNSSIPMSFSSLSNMLRLNLSRNSFSGEIPSNLRALKNLITLSLAQNELQGPIPEFLGELIDLQYLDLSHNNLLGEIPKSLEALTQLSYFNVSFNQLIGEIPHGGPFSNFTGESFLSNSKLCGLSQFNVSPCPSSSHRSRKKPSRILLYVLIPIASVIIATAIIVLFLLRGRRNVISQNVVSLTTTTHKRITYYELSNATNSFSESNLLGVGSYGAVYKGIFKDGTTLAIKVFNLQAEGGFKSFDKECEILSQLRHRNLTKVITSCSNEDFKALVLEYMPNGNLGNWLHDDTNYLSFLQRLDIMIDVACALEYLHHGYSVSVAHCDLKPNNVLLDDDMVAHVCDFGISRLLGMEESVTQTRTLGTIGYIAPEYGLDGMVSIRCDVYSFGIVLMEIFTMKKPTDDIFSGEMNLPKWVNGSFPHGIVEIIDSNLLSMEQGLADKKIHCASSIMELALNCSVELAEERLSMKDVCHTLREIKSQFLA